MTHIHTPYGFHTTTDEVLQGIDLTGKRALVTGAASGIGVETARALASVGAQVTLAVRNTVAGQAVADIIRAATGNPHIQVVPLDLANQTSVRALTEAWTSPLHILVNNAGIMALPNLEQSPEGWELQFATNYLGHFALTQGLYHALAAANGARIVSLASNGHLFSPVVFDDLHYRFRPYDPWTAYGQSKTAAILLAVEASRRWGEDGIMANALNPGAIATNLQKHTGGLRTPVERQKTVRQGAATSVMLAASPLLDGIGGRYFEDLNEAELVTQRPADYLGVAPYALDPENARRLWDVATDLIH
ncbi:SDR family NAD(P)-dependent oxidoreductase [Deinococcus humi]|uniref:Probable oxidoreductase n=1 Tax=Deinococcus humi TaxID=662880 RepID=A0A7W8K0B9_9DEIO|nr:SDR family NAD(P)-dependent oxidoreductase [Deinococcus humi]MBB5365253.1 NAD(P)-dependent dehydrogenase (short-subunit alcohol dehydrogenase family) [Deinococcus humi]GGO35766.1 oxidoreductase [Deinococcus humi]